jgi:16S rRNA (guanine1516-N2)-methyltransferase
LKDASMTAQADFKLERREGHLTLICSSDPSLGAVSVDFDDSSLAWRQRRPSQPEALLKAVGARTGQPLRILDATAGFGLDAFMLANAGCDVLLLERNAVVHALLADGLQRAADSEDDRVRRAVSRMRLLHTDSTLIGLDILGGVPDVVYLDPMFPERRRKSAKVKKNMAMLQRLLDAEADAPGMLAWAMALGARRVVVKRPRIAGFLDDCRPSYQLAGSSSRFDVYLCQPSSLSSTSS